MTGNYTDRRLETVFKLYSDIPVTAETLEYGKVVLAFGAHRSEHTHLLLF